MKCSLQSVLNVYKDFSKKTDLKRYIIKGFKGPEIPPKRCKEEFNFCQYLYIAINCYI